MRRARAIAAAMAMAGCMALAGCSDDDAGTGSKDDAGKEHVWKDQKRALDKARDVGRQLEEAAARKKDAQ